MSTSSRVALFFAIALVACIYLVSAAPIVNDESAQLELASVSPFKINVFKKHHEDNEDNEDYEEESEETITTTTKRHKHKQTSTATATTTTAKATTTTTSAEPTPTITKKKSASSSGSSGYSGDATYYGTGMGSCGHDSSDSDYIVALNYGQMNNGANPNNNPLCGKKITAKGPNGSVIVTIVDTCPGCAYGDLDLSPAAFAKIADMARGRVPITWSFN
ncbi:hypothetical protein INT47_000351 [Mucor saturninus]|uniref:RlpA-like protein double-psi beta-barrel domain-containing protein n=1 Tax=Mucor saturninus TaxID=64648 RepID=A0A8H7UVC5_9FUNG|nr:hypothetical protein INT47_000351 [Mucor saturninus]